MDRTTIILHMGLLEKLKILEVTERWQIIEAAFDYCKTGKEPDFTDRAMKAIWVDAKQTIDFYSSKYAERCERNRENIRKRWNKEDTGVYDGIPPYTNYTDRNKIGLDKDMDLKERDKEKPDEPSFSLHSLNEESHTEKPKRAIFQKPTVEEVTAYCKERGNAVNPQTFIDFYEARGWMLGKNHMKDWKAAVRTWEQRSQSTNQSENVGIVDIDAAIRKAQGR